jgi:hypothetical protein
MRRLPSWLLRTEISWSLQEMFGNDGLTYDSQQIDS